MTSLRARCCSFWANPNSPSPPSNAMASDCRMHIILFSGNRRLGHAKPASIRPSKTSRSGSAWLITGSRIVGPTPVSPRRNAARTLSPANEFSPAGKESKMRGSKFLCVAMGAMFAAAAACADEITVVSNVRGPEGPLYVDGNLYYVGWVSNTLSKWDGKTTTVLNNTPGCGHNGLALTKKRTFLLAWTNEPGAILGLDMTGKQLRRWDVERRGKKFDGGINDIVVTASGGAYATVFGPYPDPPIPTSVIGKILYLARGSERWVAVANDLK